MTLQPKSSIVWLLHTVKAYTKVQQCGQNRFGISLFCARFQQFEKRKENEKQREKKKQKNNIVHNLLIGIRIAY